MWSRADREDHKTDRKNSVSFATCGVNLRGDSSNILSGGITISTIELLPDGLLMNSPDDEWVGGADTKGS